MLRPARPAADWGRRRAALLLAGVLVVLLPTGIMAGHGAAAAQGVGALARADELPILHAIAVPQAWRVTKGKGVVVAVLDTGADPSAPDLTGSVVTGPDFTAGSDPSGYQPPRQHGTYIASLIAGHGSGPGRTEGIIGVAPQAKLLSVRVILDDSEPGFLVFNENASYYDSIASGIRYAVRHRADVINMSLGSTSPTRDLREAVGYAISRGVVVVAAAGNDGSARQRFTRYSYPASFTGVISVAAVDSHGKRASFSDRNPSVVVSAPGVRVAGAGPGGTYLIASGTSPASALVAGVAALIRSRFPQLSPAQVTQAIIESARRTPAGGYSTSTGFGEVDAAAALTVAARLARARTVAGMAADSHFGGRAPGPIVVVHRDHAQIAILLTMAATAGLACLALIVALAMTLARRRHARSPRASVPSAPSVTTVPAVPTGPTMTAVPAEPAVSAVSVVSAEPVVSADPAAPFPDPLAPSDDPAADSLPMDK